MSSSLAGTGPVTTSYDPSEILGTTGLRQYSGVIDEERLVRLRGVNGARFYQEMVDNSPVLASAFSAIKLLIRQTEFRLEPGDGSPQAAEIQEFVDGCLEDMEHTFDEFIDSALSFLQYGYCAFEKVFKLRRSRDASDKRLRSKFDDGRIGWRKFEIRSQDSLDRWVFDEDGDIAGFIQIDIYSSRGPVFIPWEKILLFRTETFKNNPEGRSILRPAVVPYHFVKRIQEFEAIGTERDLAGMPIFEVPPEILMSNASPEAVAIRAELEQFVTQIRRDERWGGLVPSENKANGEPSQYRFKLLTSGGQRQIDTDTIIRRHEVRMLMLFLAQFLTMGNEGVGSYSLSSNMTDLFATAIGTYMDRICDILNRYAIPQLLDVNGLPAELAPKMVHGDIEGPNLEELGRYLVALAQTGQPLDHDNLRRKLLEVAGLPIDEDEFSQDNTVDDGGQQTSAAASSVNASITPEQTKTLIEINAAVSQETMSFNAARAAVSALLGVDSGTAESFVERP